jgi:hypothetical protein
MGVQKHYKKRFEKKSCRKIFTKNLTKNPIPIFFLIFLNHVFRRFSVRGVKKHDKKYRRNKSHLIPFSYSDPLTHHGGRCLFFWPAPWPTAHSPQPTVTPTVAVAVHSPRWPTVLSAAARRGTPAAGSRQ